jgi:acyl dehydratase
LALKTDAIGKTYPAVTYAVGREKVREFASAVGEEGALHHDPEAARAAGYADVVAPPMFAVVYGGRAMAPALFDPHVGIDFARMVHGGQEFVWGPPVVAGDEVATEVEVKNIADRGGLLFYVFESRSTNQEGETVCTGTWTNIVR